MITPARSIAIKELRETWGIAAGAMLLYVWMLATLMRPGESNIPYLFIVGGRPGVPFLSHDFSMVFMLTASLFALVLGFRQTFGESLQGTYLFVLHRCESPSVMFLPKLAVGIGLVLLGSAWPIVVYAAWAATPGNVPAPFDWSMTASAWRQLAVVPLLYLGAFLSALRPARWFGTRLVPLFSAVTAMFFFFEVTWPAGIRWIYLIAAYALFVATILYVARTRDYS
jgi:hypothetical protein